MLTCKQGARAIHMQLFPFHYDARPLAHFDSVSGLHNTREPLAIQCTHCLFHTGRPGFTLLVPHHPATPVRWIRTPEPESVGPEVPLKR